jgi:hypothetical protein
MWIWPIGFLADARFRPNMTTRCFAESWPKPAVGDEAHHHPWRA